MKKTISNNTNVNFDAIMDRIKELLLRIATFLMGSRKTCKVWRLTVKDIDLSGDDPTAGWDQVALPRNAAFDRIKQRGGDPENHIIIVRSAIDEYDRDRGIRLDLLNEILEHGLDVPDFVTTKIRHFDLLTAGASMIRNSGFMMASPKIIGDTWDRAFAGFSPVGRKAAPNKVLSYCGLQLSASRSLQEVYGFDFDIRKVVVVSEGSLEIRRRADVVSKDGARVDLDVERILRLAFDDGQSVYDATLYKGKTAPSFSYRADVGAFKGLAVPVRDLRGWFRENGITQIKDIWGSWHPVAGIQLICSKTCFKQASWTDSWEAFCDAFERREGHFRVCVEEHPAKLSRVSYQFLQTLVADDDNGIAYLAGRAKKALDKYKDPANTCTLLGDASKVASRYPAFLQHVWAQRVVQKGYATRRQKALGGSVPATGSYAFAACDPIAFLQNACGLEVTGCLQAGEVCCFEAADGHKVDVCRSPQLDHSHVILMNKTRDASKYIVHNSTMYFNVWDENTIRLRMDYDGDHVWWTQNKVIINLVEQTNSLLQMRVTDWDAPEADKPVFTFNMAKDMLYKNTQGSQIGIYADNSTRVWSRYPEIIDRFGLDSFRTVVAWLTWAGNVLIDAAKHGSVKVDEPTIVKNCLNDSFDVEVYFNGECVESRSFDLYEDALPVYEALKKIHRKGYRYSLKENRVPLPAFCEYAKADEARPVGDAHWADNCAMSNGVGDRYMSAVAAAVDEKLVVNNLNDAPFDWRDLVFDPSRKVTIKMLWSKGKRDAVTGKTVNQGLFQQIVAMRTRDIKEMDLDPAVKAVWLTDRSEVARQQIRAYAEQYGETLEAAYDIIARQLFQTNWSNTDENGEKWCDAMFRTFFSIFGDEVLKALASHGYTERIYPEEENYSDEDLSIDDLD